MNMKNKENWNAHLRTLNALARQLKNMQRTMASLKSTTTRIPKPSLASSLKRKRSGSGSKIPRAPSMR